MCQTLKVRVLTILKLDIRKTNILTHANTFDHTPILRIMSRGCSDNRGLESMLHNFLIGLQIIIVYMWIKELIS